MPKRRPEKQRDRERLWWMWAALSPVSYSELSEARRGRCGESEQVW